MKPIRIYEHHDWAGAGHLLEFLDRKNLPYEVVTVQPQSSPDDDLDSLAGVIILGADYSVNDSFPSIAAELKIIHRAMEKKMPVLGHCFGAQLISKALGGRVRPMPHWEIGWFQALCDQAALDNLCNNKKIKMEPVLLWHKEKLEVPASAKPFLGSRHCADQGFICGDNVLATMAHFEATPEIIQGWVERFKDKVPLTEKNSRIPSVQSIDKLLDGIENKVAGMYRFADLLYDVWISKVIKRAKNESSA